MQNRDGEYYKPYDFRLKEYARNNRKNPTPAEKIMWNILRSGALKNFTFSRQKPLSHFIVDFYHAKSMTAIEVDGDSHDYQIEYDTERTQKLAELGIFILRFTNKDVINNAEAVYDVILEKIQKTP